MIDYADLASPMKYVTSHEASLKRGERVYFKAQMNYLEKDIHRYDLFAQVY